MSTSKALNLANLDQAMSHSRLLAAFNGDEVLLRMDMSGDRVESNVGSKLVYKVIPFQTFTDVISSGQVDSGLLPAVLVGNSYIIVRRVIRAASKQIVLTEASPRIWTIQYTEQRGSIDSNSKPINFKLWLPHLLMCSVSSLATNAKVGSLQRSSLFAMQGPLLDNNALVQGLMLPNVNPDYNRPDVCWGTNSSSGALSDACSLIPLFFSSLFNYDYLYANAHGWLADWQQWSKEKAYDKPGFDFFSFINERTHRFAGLAERAPIMLGNYLSTLVGREI